MKFLRKLLLPLLSILLVAGNQTLENLYSYPLGVSSSVKHTTKADVNARDCAKQGVGVPKVHVPKDLTQKITKPNTKWKPTVTADGTKVYRRNDLFDPKFIDGKGRTNLQRMQQGRAPLGIDGEPINLHHMGQGNNSNLVELTKKQHIKYSKQIHINPNSIGSDIDRAAFKKWREAYWKNIAKELIKD